VSFERSCTWRARHEGPRSGPGISIAFLLPALRLFAQIELCRRATRELPQLGGRSIRPGPGGLRDMMRARDERAAPPLPALAMPVVRPPRKPSVATFARPPHLAGDGAGPATGRRGGSGSDFVEIRNATLKAVVSTLHEVTEVRIDWPSSLNSGGGATISSWCCRGRKSREAILELMREGRRETLWRRESARSSGRETPTC